MSPPARALVTVEPEVPATFVKTGAESRYSYGIAAGIVIVLLAGAGYLVRSGAPTSQFDTFWDPFFKGVNELRICIPTPDTYRIYGSSRNALIEAFRPLPPGTTRPKVQEERLQDVQIVPEIGFFLGIGDAQAMSLLSTFAIGRGKTAQIRHGNETSFSELRAGPSILLGGFTNRWTLI